MITDRTQADTTSINKNGTVVQKGAYNYTDLNRVEAKVKELNDILIASGYMTSLTTKLDWSMTDKFNQNDSTRYLNNIQAIRSALAVKPTTPQVPRNNGKFKL